MQMTKIIDSIAKKKIEELNKYGYILAGHNGPYYDTDTPVRNTAHWAIIFSYYYQKTNDKKYYDAIYKCGNYLISKEARPMDANFFCRYNTHKDFANGTIGAAWVIEGLVASYKITNDSNFLKVAKKVFLLFPFDQKYNLWKIVNVDGSIRGFDMTFNHQLWFAASGVILLSVIEDDEIAERCKLFFDNIHKYFRTYQNGLIKHSIVPKVTKVDKIKGILKICRNIYLKIKTNKSTKYKENGYHLFNMYAFALIKDYGYNLKIFKKKKFQKALNYCFNDELFNWLENKSINLDINNMPKVKNSNININIYAYPYNGAGFELPYIYKVFSNELPDKDYFVKEIVKKQIEFTFNSDKKSFSKNTEDENTLNARIYEFVRSLNIEDN